MLAWLQSSRFGSFTTPATWAVCPCEQSTTVLWSDLASACWGVMVLQAPTVGAPAMPPARCGPAYDGPVAPRAVTVRAAATAITCVVEILMSDAS